jgi:hypothetical protein
MPRQRLMWILWPAFLTASVLELLVFALVDPQDLHWFGQPLDLSREGVYSAAFFMFWGVCICACSLTALLCRSPEEVNRSQSALH